MKILVEEMVKRMRPWRPCEGSGRDSILLVMGLRSVVVHC